MRKLLFVAAALCAIAWSGAAWAIVVDTTPKTPAGPETPGTEVHLVITNKEGKTVAKKTAKVEKDGTAKIEISDKEKEEAKGGTVEMTSTTGGKTYENKIPFDTFMNGGDFALALVSSNIKQLGLATHHPVAQHPASFKISEDTTPVPADRMYFEFGFGGGESWTKTNADSFGPGIGPGTFFPNTNSSSFLALNAGVFFPVFSGVAVGPVMELITGDFNATTITHTTPTGVVSASQVLRGVEFDAMGRAYVALPGLWGGSGFVQGGIAVGRYKGSMVNAGIETFEDSTLTTSLIAGGGGKLPLCPFLAIPVDQSGICPVQGVVEYNHVFVDKTFSTGITAASSATAEVRGIDRVMAGLVFENPVGNAPNWGRWPNWGW